MIPVSVVIITKNEAHVIGNTIGKARLFTDDIVVIDNGSTDGTIQFLQANGCRVYQKKWDGYAANKNKGIELAKYDWILSLDADEVPDDMLIDNLLRTSLNDIEKIYDIQFKSYFGDQQIRFGKWGRDHHIRLFNRTHVKWLDCPVHETLTLTAAIKKSCLKGYIHHYSVTDLNDFKTKSERYAILSARQYFSVGKKPTFIKLYLSPLFNFIKNYIILLGFLDGRNGWLIANITFKQTSLKYSLLKEMEYNVMSQKMSIGKKLSIDY